MISWHSCRALKSLYFRHILKAWGPPYWTRWHWANPSWPHGLVVFQRQCRTASLDSWYPLAIHRRWQTLCAIFSVILNTFKPLGGLGANGWSTLSRWSRWSAVP